MPGSALPAGQRTAPKASYPGSRLSMTLNTLSSRDAPGFSGQVAQPTHGFTQHAKAWLARVRGPSAHTPKPAA
jgi:hypothetical protein